MSNLVPVNLCLGKLRLSVMGAAEIVKSIWLISMWSVCERFPVLFLNSSSPASSSLLNRAHLISSPEEAVEHLDLAALHTAVSCSSVITINMTDLDRQPCGPSNFAVNVAKKCFRQTQLLPTCMNNQEMRAWTGRTVLSRSRLCCSGCIQAHKYYLLFF